MSGLVPFICTIENEINKDQHFVYSFPNLKQRFEKRTYLSPQLQLQTKQFKDDEEEDVVLAPTMQIQSKSSRDCLLVFSEKKTTTPRKLELKLKFHNLEDKYTIDLKNIYSKDLVFEIKSKSHVSISCTRYFERQLVLEIEGETSQENKKDQTSQENKKDRENQEREKDQTSQENKKDQTSQEKKEIEKVQENQEREKGWEFKKKTRRQTIIMGVCFYCIFMIKYYSKMDLFVQIKTETRSMKDLALNFVAIGMTYLVDYWPSFQFAKCDVWLSHVFNSAIRSFNMEYNFSFDEDVNFVEWLDYITPSFFIHKNSNQSMKSKFNQKFLMPFKREDCCSFIREGYLHLLGDDEKYPFKPLQELISRFRLVQDQQITNFLLAMFLAYYQQCILTF